MKNFSFILILSGTYFLLSCSGSEIFSNCFDDVQSATEEVSDCGVDFAPVIQIDATTNIFPRQERSIYYY